MPFSFPNAGNHWLLSGGGNAVLIEHPRCGVHPEYLHLSRLAVTAGRRVKKRQVIGYAGNPSGYFRDGSASTCRRRCTYGSRRPQRSSPRRPPRWPASAPFPASSSGPGPICPGRPRTSSSFTAPHPSPGAGLFCVMPHWPALLQTGSSCYGCRELRNTMLRTSVHVRHAVLAEDALRDLAATLTPVLGRSGFHAVFGHIFMVLCGPLEVKSPDAPGHRSPPSWLQVHGGRWSQPRGLGTVLGVLRGNVSHGQCHVPRSRYGRELCFSLGLPCGHGISGDSATAGHWSGCNSTELDGIRGKNFAELDTPGIHQKAPPFRG